MNGVESIGKIFWRVIQGDFVLADWYRRAGFLHKVRLSKHLKS